MRTVHRRLTRQGRAARPELRGRGTGGSTALGAFRHRALGVSLIEALVALAVMGFGTLSVLSVQGTLRMNADVARQRSEALRLAQEAIESSRQALVSLAAFDALADSGPEEFTSINNDTRYSRTVSVSPAELALDDDGVEIPGERPRYKSVAVSVEWTDRNGTLQTVRLNTIAHGVLPELTGSISIASTGAPVQAPRGRHPAIPAEAVDQGDGSSLFAPPGAASGVRWRFLNTSGVITRLCDGCADVTALLLSGYVRYALTSIPPVGADAEVPPSAAVAVGVQVAQTAPADVPAPTCYTDLEAAYLSYYCAVQISLPNLAWSGQSSLVGGPGWVLSTGNEADRYRVCRYTRLVGSPAVPSTANADHPATYVNVGMPLANQNFLVIRAGSGVADSAPFDCPGDDSTTPLISGQTWLHQP